MRQITTLIELREEIASLEITQLNNEIALKEQLKITYDSLRPLNLIKSTFKDLTSAPDFKGDFLNSTMGISAGYLTKKIIVGASHNPIKKLLGTLLQVGITSIVAKNGDGIKSVAIKVIGSLLPKKNTTDKDN
jgi:hypothetical protein